MIIGQSRLSTLYSKSTFWTSYDTWIALVVVYLLMETAPGTTFSPALEKFLELTVKNINKVILALNGPFKAVASIPPRIMLYCPLTFWWFEVPLALKGARFSQVAQLLVGFAVEENLPYSRVMLTTCLQTFDAQLNNLFISWNFSVICRCHFFVWA